MGLEFDPRLEASSSRQKKSSEAKSSRSSASAGASSSTRSSRSSPRSSSSRSSGLSTGKRGAVSARDKYRAKSSSRSSSRSASKSSSSSSSTKRGSRSSTGSRKLTKAEKQLAKLEKENAKLEAKNAKKQMKADAKEAKKEEKRARKAGVATSSQPRRASRSVAEVAARDGQRVGDIRKREREERNRARYRRYVIRVAVTAVVLFAIGASAVYVYRSDLFAITEVKANGVTHLTSSEITEIAAVPEDSTILRLDSDGIVERLESNAWVQSATVTREFPDTVVIDIVERTPAAVVALDETTYWVIASDGAWLSAATDEDLEDLMLITDVSSSVADPLSGSDCDDGGIENALAIVEGISDELKDKVESVSAESSIKTSLNMKDGVVIAFGDSSDIELKESVIEELLDKYEGKISYINVRVPSRPTYRTLVE